MATATKTLRAFQTSASNSAGGTTTGSSFDLRTALGCFVVAKITNGATGPTIGCDFVVEVSNDNSDWHEVFRATAGTANSGAYRFSVELPATILYARTVFTGNTGQAVTVEADGHEFTSLG